MGTHLIKPPVFNDAPFSIAWEPGTCVITTFYGKYHICILMYDFYQGNILVLEKNAFSLFTAFSLPIAAFSCTNKLLFFEGKMP